MAVQDAAARRLSPETDGKAGAAALARLWLRCLALAAGLVAGLAFAPFPAQAGSAGGGASAEAAKTPSLPGGGGRILRVGPGRYYRLPSQAAKAARDGDRIEIDAGIYSGDVAIWRANDLVIRGVGGRPELRAAGRYAEGKAIWVVKGANTTIENIAFTGARVPDRNGAGIRAEGAGLTVRHALFRDNENGILAGSNPDSDIVVEYSEFDSNGAGGGRTHNIYVGAIRSFTFRFNYSHHARIGHLVKSQAHRNLILYNRLMDEKTGTSSYAIDLSTGGIAYVIGNLIHQGTETDNWAMVSFAAEGMSAGPQALYVVNNTFVNDRHSGLFVSNRSTAPALVLNNLFVGKGRVLEGPGRTAGNVSTQRPRFRDRAGYDYRLRAGSPAIDAGVAPPGDTDFPLAPAWQYRHLAQAEKRPRRGALDAGAYEFAGE